MKINDVGAIFFPVKDQVKQEIVDELHEDGFWVGNHSETHANLAELPTKGSILNEMARGYVSDLARPPYGAFYLDENKEVGFDNRVPIALSRLGMRTCLWTVDTNDWTGNSANEIVSIVDTEAQGGSVVLMHMNDRYNTIDALQPMIDALRDSGRQLCAPPSQPTATYVPENLPC